MGTFTYEGEQHELPDWLLSAASVDPEATARVLLRMRRHWPADFIRLLEFHVFALPVNWPVRKSVDQEN